MFAIPLFTQPTTTPKKDDYWLDVEERTLGETQEHVQNERENEKRKRRRIKKEREREDNEREQMRFDRERGIEDRERDRQVIERATKEARKIAAAEARAKANRVVVDKVNVEARGRA